MIAMAVNSLVIEPIRYWSSTVAARPARAYAPPITWQGTTTPSTFTDRKSGG